MHKMLPLLIRLWRLKQQIASLPTMFTKKCIKDSQDLTPDGSASKESACNAGDLGSIPELERPPGEGKGHPLQYSGLELSMDCIVHGVTKSQTQLKEFHFHLIV